MLGRCLAFFLLCCPSYILTQSFPTTSPPLSPHQIQKWLCGILERSRSKAPFHPFAHGKWLMDLAHQVGVYFAYGTRMDDLTKLCTVCDCAMIVITVDHNDTRCSAQIGLLTDILRLRKAISMYAVQHTVPWSITEETWAAWTELEGILYLVKHTTTLIQTENLYTGAFIPHVKNITLEGLRKDTIPLIDHAQLTKSPHLPRRAVKVADFSDTGKTAVYRGINRAEQEYNGNHTMVNDGQAMHYSDGELVATLCDLRTVLCLDFTDERRHAAKANFIAAYVDFKVTAAQFELAERVIEAAVEPVPDLGGGGGGPVPAHEDAPRRGSWGLADVEEVIDIDANLEMTAEELATKKVAYEHEAKKALGHWITLAGSIDWRSKYPQATFPEYPAALDLVQHLLPLDIGPLYVEIAKQDKKQQYGIIPLMARCYLGVLGAESFAERVISAANDIMTEGHTLLKDEELEMLVVLRINRDFMKFMRAFHGEHAKQTFNQTVIAPGMF